ncbi:MAG: efflux RND transporter permease subunit [Planctomycetes bacterium]|nr:efflux RND transporter permease subunit [Planctomycetota bacterium]MBI3835167.1 efflux RND transporter permease subunit [Planctomycetota bacterium]
MRIVPSQDDFPAPEHGRSSLLQRLVAISISFRSVVIILAGVLILFGLYTVQHAKFDVLPDFVPPQVVIQCEAPGLSPEQVEALVTRPIETAINGAGHVESVRSQSIQGLCVLTVVFQEGTDILVDRQLLSERLSAIAGTLPTGVKAPKMEPMTSGTMDLLKLGIHSDTASPFELRAFADWTLRPRLLSVNGVAVVSVFGGNVRQLQIQVNPDRLAALDVSMDDLLAAARNATGIRGAGFVETDAQRIVIRTEGQSPTPEELGAVIIAPQGREPVRIADVANVTFAAAPKFGDALIMGKPGVLLTMLSQYGANTLEVTEAVEQALEEMRPALESEHITLYPRLHRPATFVENAIHNINSSLELGAVLVAVVLFLFLWNLRCAIISISAIPLSLLTAVIIMDRFGITLNTMTLGGLAIAIGEVVDDAIIDVENIYRRLRENRNQPHPRHPLRVVLDASMEVRGAVVYATLIVATVFIPVLTMSGLQGRLFSPLGIAYILAIMSSLVVALTITPAMCAVLLPRRAEIAHEPKLQTALKSAYVRLMTPITHHPWFILFVLVILVAGATSLVPYFGGEFLPDFTEGHFVPHVSAVPGTSLAELRRIGEQISADLLANPLIATVEQQIGRAELGEDTFGPHRSEFHIELKPTSADQDQNVRNFIRHSLETYPGVATDVLTFLGDRISETMSGETAEVVVNVFGDDLDLLDEKATQVQNLLSSLRGAVDVQVVAPPGSPQMLISLRHESLRQFGFQPVEVLDAIQTAFQGAQVGEINSGRQVIDVVAILDESRRTEPESIRTLLLKNRDGALVPLERLADIDLTTGRYMLLHDGARRRQTVTCNVEKRDVASFVMEAKKEVDAKVDLPAGTYIAFGGSAKAREDAQRQLLVHSAIAILGIVLLLAVVVRRPSNLLLVMLNLPLALIGGLVAAFLVGRTITVGSLIGFVTLFGITTRNSIMLISHYEHLVAVEGIPWQITTALRGAAERLVPILMTALVTGLGLLPIAVGGNEAGREIESPMAVVILGGLFTSTVLNLLVLPALAARFGTFDPRSSDPLLL